MDKAPHISLTPQCRGSGRGSAVLAFSVDAINPLVLSKSRRPVEKTPCGGLPACCLPSLIPALLPRDNEEEAQVLNFSVRRYSLRVFDLFGHYFRGSVAVGLPRDSVVRRAQPFLLLQKGIDDLLHHTTKYALVLLNLRQIGRLPRINLGDCDLRPRETISGLPHPQATP